MGKDGGSKTKKGGGKAVAAKKKATPAPSFKKGGFSAFGQLLKGKNGGNSLSSTGGVKMIEAGSKRGFKVKDTFTEAKVKRKSVSRAKAAADQQRINATKAEQAEFNRQQASLFERSLQQQAASAEVSLRKALTRKGMRPASAAAPGAAFAAASANAILFVDRRTPAEIEAQRVAAVDAAMRGLGGAPVGGGGYGGAGGLAMAGTDHGDLDYDPSFHLKAAEKYVLQPKRKGKKSANAFSALAGSSDEEGSDMEDGGHAATGRGSQHRPLGAGLQGIGVLGEAGLGAFFEKPAVAAAAPKVVGGFAFAKPTFFYEGDMTNPADTLDEEEAFMRGRGGR